MKLREEVVRGERGGGVGGRIGREGVGREGVREEREACGSSKFTIPRTSRDNLVNL